MSWELETEEQSWLKEWYELKPKFRVKCREVSCEREEILYHSIDNFTEHMKGAHQKIAICEAKTVEKAESEIRHPGSNNWKYFVLCEELQPLLLEDLQPAPEIVQYSIKCILCSTIIPCNNESAIDNHIIKEHSDIEKEYGERNFSDSWPWKYQTKLGLGFIVKCNYCGEYCVTLESSTEILKKHYEENHKTIWERKFKQGKAHDQAGPSTELFLENRKDRTLKSEFEKHSWLKMCYECQPVLYFCVKCLAETCEKKYVLYVDIKNFAEHMRTNHITICELEDEKCSRPDVDDDSEYFMHREQGEIECVICEKIVTNESTKEHMNNHRFYFNRSTLNIELMNIYINIKKNWIWKYQKQSGDYIVKCRLCREDSSRIHLTPDTTNLKSHYINMHKDKWAEMEHIWKQEEMQEQAGPSTQLFLENKKDRTLKSEFEKHSWLKMCYECQPVLYFCVKCLAETCEKKYVLYVDIKNFAEHMRTNHITICELEDEKCSRPDVDDDSEYFMHREQGEIECVICEKIVTNESTKEHMNNHRFYFNRSTLNIELMNIYINIKKNWIWKYQKQSGDYIVKCRLCREDSSRIHLTPDTTNLKSHYINMHKDKWVEMEHIWKQEEMQEQAGPSRKLQQTS